LLPGVWLAVSNRQDSLESSRPGLLGWHPHILAYALKAAATSAD